MEHWKTIDGFNKYEVSNLGRVRRAKSGRIRAISKTRYPQLNLHKGGKRYTVKVHLLVARAFVPVPLELVGKDIEVNHKKTTFDNEAVNLEWLTTSAHGKDKAKRHQQGLGICPRPRGKWTAYYSPKGKQRFLGTFNTPEEAKVARDAAVATL